MAASTKSAMAGAMETIITEAIEASDLDIRTRSRTSDMCLIAAEHGHA